MHIAAQKKGLTEYFQHSGQFYYILADPQGNYIYGNPLFLQRFNHITALFLGKNIEAIFIPTDGGVYRDALHKCLQKPGMAVQAGLHVSMQDDSLYFIKWEISACLDEENNIGSIQLIGADTDTVLTGMHEIGKSAVRLPERYRAYEQSAEGLWMCESKEPVSVTDTPEAIIEYWKKNSFLAECNDNMARMYGFEKAGEMIGTVLEELMDFSDPVRMEGLRSFIRDGFKTTSLETKEFDRHGNTKYFLNSMTGIVEKGMLTRVWGTQQDITEQRMAEQHLQQSELFYRNLIADSLDGILLTDEKGIISFASPSVTKLLGYETHELIGRSAFEYVHPDDREVAVTTFEEEGRMQPRVKFITIKLIKKDGDQVWCIVRGHNLLNNPYISRMAIYFYDDTLRKSAEEALVQSGRKLRTQATLLNNVTDVIVTTNPGRVVTSWNKVTEKLTGIMAEEAIGKPFRDIIDTDYSPYTHDQVADIVTSHGIWRGEISFEGSGGEKKYLLHTVSLLHNEEGKNIGMLGVGKDITERKKIEARLQESELFYRNLISYSLDGILLTDRNGQVIYCAPSVTKLSGYEPQHLLGHSIFEFVHPDDHAIANQAFFTEIDKKSTIDYLVIRLKHSEYDWVWCTVRGHNLLDNPVFNAFVVYFTNDSKRKEIEDRLKESEHHFRNLIYNLSQGIVLQNDKGEVTVCNKAAELILGITEEELMGATSYEARWNAIHEDGTPFPGHTHPASEAIRTKKPVHDVVMGVFRSTKGDRIWVLVSADPTLDSNADVVNVIISFTDITEQKRLSQELIEQEIHKQKQLTQATIDGQEKERREIGKELHDNINQHLTTTRLYLEVAKEKASGEVLEMIHLAHKNLAAIITEIRQLSQSLVPPTLGDLGLVESVYDLSDSLKRAHAFQIEFLHRHFNEEELPGNMKLMLFRIIQEQVNNILRHANANTIQIRLQSDAEYIILSIMDDGKGFDTLNFRKGLGFSNISNRAGLFNGKVEIEAAPGQGCTLSVIIPLEETADTVN